MSGGGGGGSRTWQPTDWRDVPPQPWVANLDESSRRVALLELLAERLQVQVAALIAEVADLTERVEALDHRKIVRALS